MGLAEIKRLKETAHLPKPKKQYIIPPVSEKKKLRDRQEAADCTDDEKLSLWFPARRLEMTGVCAHCGGKSCRDSDEFFAYSIAHILPKNPKAFPSIATHPLNWIELCFWDNNCHANYDNKILVISDLNCFDTVVERFRDFYPYIAHDERRRIPDILKNYINVDL